jgi:hypothetical protein
VLLDGKNQSFQAYRGVGEGSTLSAVLFNMATDEIVRTVTGGGQSGIPEIMV